MSHIVDDISARLVLNTLKGNHETMQLLEGLMAFGGISPSDIADMLCQATAGLGVFDAFPDGISPEMYRRMLTAALELHLSDLAANANG